MFFKKNNSAQEIEKSVLEQLPSVETAEDNSFQTALQSLAHSADLFEAMDLQDEAEIITQFMETIASGQFAMIKEAKKKSKKKTKSKSKKKSKTKHTEIAPDSFVMDLTPEKEVENLKNIGWMFSSPNTNNGRECSDDNSVEDLPEDYEQCGECGYDHQYEPEEAFNAHFPQKINDYDNDFLINSIDV